MSIPFEYLLKNVNTVIYGQVIFFSFPRSLQLVMEQISANARDLSDLHKAVEVHNHSSLEERETSVKTRDQQLKSE